MRRRQAGFTLTEMMVVVTIIGILVTMAIVYVRGRVRPMDVANRVGDLVREASRRAVALGPVRANVAIALGSSARTKVTAVPDDPPRTVPGTSITFTAVTFQVWRLQEDPPAIPPGPCLVYPCWVPIPNLQYKTDLNVDVVSWALGIVGYTSPGNTSWGGWADPNSATLPLQCRSDGTCSACSIFFKAVLPGPSCDPAQPATVPLNEQCGKLAVLPLGGAITIRADWN